MVNTKEMTESLIKELAFSEEELRELKAAKEKPIVFDEDCPETIKSMGYIGRVGMKDTDTEILNIMIDRVDIDEVCK